MGYILSLVTAIVTAGPGDLPVESNSRSGAFHTSDWSVPTLTGDPNIVLKNHEVRQRLGRGNASATQMTNLCVPVQRARPPVHQG